MLVCKIAFAFPFADVSAVNFEFVFFTFRVFCSLIVTAV